MAVRDEKQLLGPWMTLSLVIGAMIGAGIFLLPVSLAPLGPNAVVGWLVSSVGALCLAFALARLTRSDGAGIQAYIERAFGPTVAFLVAWAFWCSVWTANAALAIGAAAALSRVSPLLSNQALVAPMAIGFILFLTLVNAMGARSAGRMTILTVAIKVLPLLAVIAIMALRGAEGRAFEPLAPSPLTFDNIATAVALTLFALTGFEAATAPVDKVRNPARTLPLAILGGTAIVALIYLFSSTAVLLLLPADVVAGSAAPFADAVGAQWGEGAATFTALAMAVSAFGCLNVGILVAGELAYSMALRRDLTPFLARTRGAATPVAAQILAAGLAVLLVLLNSSRATASLFTFVILLSTVATLVLYVVGALAALKGRPSTPATAAIVIGLLFALFAFYGSGREANLWGLVLLAIGLAVRTVMRWLNSRGSSPESALAPDAPRE